MGNLAFCSHLYPGQIGDADVRIDFTHTTGQVTGIDLDGDGSIEALGVESNIAGAGVLSTSGFTKVDAYARNPLNELDHNNFLGDIKFTQVTEIAALISAGKTISSVTEIGQTEDGSSIVSGVFDDTLVFQQADFSASTKFTIVLDDFLVAGGVLYDLTNGNVKYSANDHDSATVPEIVDYESLVLKVDGVENVIGGLGDDRIVYQNNFNAGGNEKAAEPTITIKVLSAGEETVTSTSGRVGTTVAVDMLHRVERITLDGYTAEGSKEVDLLDVTSLTSGAVVDYTNGEVRSSLIEGTGVYANAAGITISLTATGAAVGGFNFDFDVLDVTKVTNSGLILNGVAAGTDDEVVLGALSKVSTINAFESVVLSDASVAAGTNFTFNTQAGTLVQGSTTVNTGAADTLSFSGVVLEGGTNTVADVTVNVAGSTGVTVYGGAGNDTLDGGTLAEVLTINVTGVLSAAVGGAVILTLGGYAGLATTVTEGDEIVAGAGNDAVGAALATKINANLADINSHATWGEGSLSHASYDAGTDQLTFTFTTGADVTCTVSSTIRRSDR